MDQGLTKQQERWMASVREGLERDTGRSLDDWAAIARTCPEQGQRAQLRWFKEVHGLQQNRAMMVLQHATGKAGTPADEAEALAAALWADPACLTVLRALEARLQALPEVVRGQRKAYTAFSRRFQFAALRPLKGGGARLGLALAPETSPRLEPPRREPWSERLTAAISLSGPADIDAEVEGWLSRAWAAS